MRIHLAFVPALLLSFASLTLAQSSTKPMRAAGRVDAVTQESLTIVAGSEKITVVVNGDTKLVGKGLGTKTKNMKGEGQGPVLSDLVKPADSVVVTYVDGGGGKLRATEVNVRAASK
jgi:hypothetical protein